MSCGNWRDWRRYEIAGPGRRPARRQDETAPGPCGACCGMVRRSALESIVVGRLKEHGIDATKATMRSRLACLRVVDPLFGEAAGLIWAGLTRCCHHHAFELSPSAAEIQSYLKALRDGY